MPAAAYRDSQALPHRVLHGIDHLLGGAHQAHVIWLAGKSAATPPDEIGISRILRSDGHRLGPLLSDKAPSVRGSRGGSGHGQRDHPPTNSIIYTTAPRGATSNAATPLP